MTIPGNVCKNGNTNNFNDSIDADEEMGKFSLFQNVIK